MEANEAVSGCNILILSVDASVLPPFGRSAYGREQPGFAVLSGDFAK
jgi:hypothetical protein